MIRIILFIFSIFFLSSCATIDNGDIIPSDKISKKNIKAADTTLDEHRVNVGLLVPLSKQKGVGDSLIKSAQLAIINSKYNAVNLVILNSELLREDFNSQLRKMEEQKVKVIIGPVYAADTEKLVDMLNNKDYTILSLSNDSSIKSEKLLIMGVSPESQAKAITNYAIGSGVNRVNLIVPEGKYGKLVDVAVEEAVLQKNNVSHTVYWYNKSNITEVLDQALANVKNNPNEAVFMPQGGDNLSALNEQLENHKLNKVKLLGLQGWDNPAVFEMKSLNNAVIIRKNLSEEQFYDNYSRIFNRPATNIDFVTYNVLTMIINMHRDQVYISKPSIIENNSGIRKFSEVRFDQDGLSNYKFSLSRISNGEFVHIEDIE